MTLRKIGAASAATLVGAGGIFAALTLLPSSPQPNFGAIRSDLILGIDPRIKEDSEEILFHYISDQQADPSTYLFHDGEDISYARKVISGAQTTVIFDTNKVFRDRSGKTFHIKEATTSPTEWNNRAAHSNWFSIAFAQTTDTFDAAGYTTWTVPSDVNSADIACWGGGGAGRDGSGLGGGSGGGGGAFASSTVSVTPSDVIRIFIGAGGATTGANGATSTASTTAPTLLVGAPPGDGGTGDITPVGIGGRSALATGDVTAAGGNGGQGIDDSLHDGAGGGGGAGGPHGAGEVGANAIGGATDTGGAGGRGDNTLGGAAGTAGNGGAGGLGGTSTNGGGGGGGGDNNSTGAAGGPYGGGGGGGENGEGDGATGACTITYTASGGGTTIDDTYFEVID